VIVGLSFSCIYFYYGFKFTLFYVVFAMFGMLSPASRGALMTAAIVFFMFMGYVNHLLV